MSHITRCCTSGQLWATLQRVLMSSSLCIVAHLYLHDNEGFLALHSKRFLVQEDTNTPRLSTNVFMRFANRCVNTILPCTIFPVFEKKQLETYVAVTLASTRTLFFTFEGFLFLESIQRAVFKACI